MSLIDRIETVKLAALTELRDATDLSALERAKGTFGARGQFTMLLRELGSLPKEFRPEAGKALNLGKQEIESNLPSDARN